MKNEKIQDRSISVHLDNLKILDERKRINDAQRDLTVDMLSELLTADKDAKGSYRRFRATFTDADVTERTKFCRRLFKRTGKDDERPPFYDTQDSVPAGAHGKIAIVRNRYNEAAYSSLSKFVTRAKTV